MLSEGAKLDQFRVLRPLGRGGMGEVYLARDTQLGRRVALKVVRPAELGSTDGVQRFMFEARATARFSHPNIVTIYAVGEVDGCPYLALEYLEGHNLHERLAHGPLALLETLRICLAVAEALETAHQGGILHRDLKPHNVIVGRDGRPRVLDFGLAKRLPDDAPPSEQREDRAAPASGKPSRDSRPAERARSLDQPEATLSPAVALAQTAVDLAGITVPAAATESEVAGIPSTGSTLSGTPAYMAPEQWLGEPTSRATDVWALGLLLYECLAGRLPYVAHSAASLAVAVTSPEPVPRIELCRPQLPPQLAELIHDCVQKNPQARPAIAEAVKVLRGLLERDRKKDATAPPFRGLLPYDQQHSDAFYGRDAEIAEAVERLRDEPLLFIVGPSGAGKSSLVAAGIAPRLRERGPLVVVRLRPGRRPFAALAARLIAASRESRPDVRRAAPRVGPATDPRRDVDQLAAELIDHPQLLAIELAELARTAGGQVLLFVDQLEELAGLVSDPELRRRFMRAIVTAADDPQLPLRALFTLRSEFLSRLAEDREVRDAMRHLMLLRAPGGGALEEVLRRPVEAAGFHYDDEQLPGEMVEAVDGEPAALPLLQFVGRLLWERRDTTHRRLLRAVYDELGGVAGALARHADGVLDGLSDAQRALARTLCLRLVTADRTRCSLARDELLGGLPPQAEEVLSRLTEARLVTARRAATSRDDAELELAHESLITSWSTLARWIDDSREQLQALGEVTEAAQLWRRRGEREDEAWSGEALREADRALARGAGELPPLVRRFLEAGRARQARLDRAARRRVRRRIGLAVGLPLLLALCATTVAVVIEGQRREAQRQHTRAERQRAEAVRQRSYAEREAARRALERDEPLEARARLRAALELHDSLRARYLWTRLARAPLSWREQRDAFATAVALSPDGGVVAGGWADGVLVLLDSATREVIAEQRNYGDQIGALRFSPDGDLLAVAGWKGSIQLWDGRGRRLRRKLRGHRGGTWALAFSPDGERLASAGSDRRVRLWNAASGAQLRSFEHPAPLTSLAFSPDGRRLLAAGFRGVARVWDVASGDQLAALESKSNHETIWGAAWSGDGTQLATAGTDGVIRLWSSGGRLVRSFGRRRGTVWAVAFSDDRTASSSRLVSGADHGAITLWDPARGTELRRLHGSRRGHIADVCFGPGGRTVFSASSDGSLRSWSLERRSLPHSAPGHRGPVYGLALHPRRPLIATGGSDRTIRLWDARSGRQLGTLRGHADAVYSLAFADGGRLLVSGGWDSTVRLWDLATHRQLAALRGHQKRIFALAVAPSGLRIASGDLSGELRLWDVRRRASGRVLQGHHGGIMKLAFSPDGKLLASSGGDGKVRLWRLPGGRELRALKQRKTARALAFASDGRQLIIGNGTALRLVDLRGRGDRRIELKAGRIYDAAALPGGRVAVATSHGAYLVDARGKRSRLPDTRSEINAIAADPRAGLAAGVGDDGTLRTWSLAGGRTLWHASMLLPRGGEIALRGRWLRLGRRGAAATSRPASRPAAAENSPADPTARSWRAAVSRDGQLARLSTDATTICVLDSQQQLALWDARTGKLRWRRAAPNTSQLQALSGACAALRGREAWLYPRRGAPRRLARSATALGVGGERMLIATAHDVMLLAAREPYRESARLELGGRTASALTTVGQQLVVGSRDGRVRLLQAGASASERTLRDTPASPVEAIAAGPAHTLFVGFANGVTGIWSARSGERMQTFRLHGPAVFLGVDRDGVAYAASELGSFVALDLRALARPYCSLMHRVWQRVPLAWVDGNPRRRSPPRNHRCARLMRRSAGPPKE